MRRRIMGGLVVGGMAVGLAVYGGKVMATPSFGFESTTIARGRLE